MTVLQCCIILQYLQNIKLMFPILDGNIPSKFFFSCVDLLLSKAGKFYMTWQLCHASKVFSNMHNTDIYNENWKIPAVSQHFSVRRSTSVPAQPHTLEGTLLDVMSLIHMLLGWSAQGGWWADHIAHLEEKINVYRVLVGKPEGQHYQNRS
jgi:hypothetical protein